ncbi:hypothetical protein HPB52_025399 [Rhipicephalus sanguineus]|uniref:Uncharacterized protein n=1 Tax=Rhipicephalus sanguineus TaxID=34632 RepID=A0A9D4PAQ5_RHISA|nr:hypothetical protein HPB52_025399 [Rhipicephalus sanguineus]
MHRKEVAPSSLESICVSRRLAPGNEPQLVFQAGAGHKDLRGGIRWGSMVGLQLLTHEVLRNAQLACRKSHGPQRLGVDHASAALDKTMEIYTRCYLLLSTLYAASSLQCPPRWLSL